MSNELKHQIKLVFGDWSNDGHGRTEDFVIVSNLSVNAMNKAYRNGSGILGFDLCDTVGKHYGDNDLSLAKKNMLVSHGYSIPSATENIWTDEFISIYLFVVKLGNPEFKYEHANLGEIHLGGYGLFN